MIKRVICAIIAVVMLAPIAFADEVTFRGIPWGTSMQDVEKAMDEEGINLYTFEDWEMRRWCSTGQMIDRERTNDAPCGWYAYGFPDDFKVAGYDVSNIDVYCVWGLSEEGEIKKEKENSLFYIGSYTLDVVDKEAAYTDLREKLSSLYGEFTEKTDSGTNFFASAYESGEYGYREWTSTWDGDDNTCVKLYCYSSDYDGDAWERVSIYYGRTDMDEYIDSLQETILEELLHQEQANRSSSVDGL